MAIKYQTIAGLICRGWIDCCQSLQDTERQYLGPVCLSTALQVLLSPNSIMPTSPCRPQQTCDVPVKLSATSLTSTCLVEDASPIFPTQTGCWLPMGHGNFSNHLDLSRRFETPKNFRVTSP